MLFCLLVWWSPGAAHHRVAGAADSPRFPVSFASRVGCCCLASGFDPSVTAARNKKGKLVRHALPHPGASVICTTRHLVHCGALRLSFWSRLCRSYVHPRRWQSSFGSTSSSVHPCVPYGSPGCCACVVVRCSCSCPLASRLDSVRGVLGSLCSLPCRASRLKWCVRRCLRAVAAGQGGSAWWHAGL